MKGKCDRCFNFVVDFESKMVLFISRGHYFFGILGLHSCDTAALLDGNTIQFIFAEFE